MMTELEDGNSSRVVAATKSIKVLAASADNAIWVCQRARQVNKRTMAKKITARNEERPFRADELFFSTTDEKGVIRSGNEVFARVSGYDDVRELIGRPHNIIRHPDMPRAVFKLMWDFLKGGNSFAGYVKNMAADGCYYWVMALVVPIQGGFLSIRFKPSSPYLAAVKELYAKLLSIEMGAGDAPEAWRAGMAAAGERLSGWLRQKGFAGYEEFMHTALAAEMFCRREAGGASDSCGAGPGRKGATATLTYGAGQAEVAGDLRMCEQIEPRLAALFSQASSFLELVQKLDAKSSFLLELADDVHLVALNGVIASTRLGESGGGLSVVTQDLASAADESAKVIAEMTDQATLTSPLRKTAFAITAAKLQVEMTIFYARELLRAGEGGSFAGRSLEGVRADIGTLIESFSRSTANMLATLPAAQSSVRARVGLNGRLSTIFRKLSRVHVTGKVQAAHITGAGHFREYFENLYELLEKAGDELREMSAGTPVLAAHLPKFEQSGRSAQSVLNSFR
jgi:PAS domain S-box-containing protein